MLARMISHPNGHIQGKIALKGSKSISNRVLLIRALSGLDYAIDNLSDSQDTQILEQLLASNADLLDAHHAGTTFRFMTAFLSLQSGEQILTGSTQMKQRPVKALVDALNELGADIEYLEEEGFPPLRIKSPSKQKKTRISLAANVSSQFVSALLLIAPTLASGLEITLEGEIVSEPYIEMTIQIMSDFGVEVIRMGKVLTVAPQSYLAKDYYVESDWSSASYMYLIAGLSESADIILQGLNKDSIQGDCAIAEIANNFGIETKYNNREIRIIKKQGVQIKDYIELNCIQFPDLVQTISLLCAGNGVQVLFSGLQTLKIKETNRIEALKNELCKVNVALMKMPQKFSKNSKIEYYLQEGKVAFPANTVEFDTYNDHRMAMSFAPLSILHPIVIRDSAVVEKSYQNFWNDLMDLGFIVELQ
ncbi:MAG: 3-phosphoshikimate 1-carboxyvinyltransferase [Chitinophagales bacterium]|nr:3-phosphoshikimate 1-carboxyvinyltransferase [Chitinophagales bacterium]